MKYIMTFKHTLCFYIFTFSLCVFYSGLSYAQDSGQNPAAAFFDLSTLNDEEGVFVSEDDDSTNDLPDVVEEDVSLRALDGDPCPKPRRAFNESPDDLKLIQEDITRFTLCVQRAQLLERLNTLAMENTDTIDSALSENIEAIAAQFMPELPDIPMPAAMPVAPMNPNMTAMPQPTARPQLDWQIQDLSGSASNLKATLINNNNNLMTVTTGDKLPNSEALVTAISASGVTVKLDDDVMTLTWKE